MDKRRRRTMIMALVIGAVMSLSTAALASEPGEVVEERTEAVATVLAQPESPQRTEVLSETIDASIDFEYLAGLALGEHWVEREEAEQENFMVLLRRLLQANYEDRLGGYELDDDYQIVYEEQRIRDERAFVPAKIESDNRRESLVYRLYRDDEGQWVIYDVVVDDISLEETYRDGYVPIIEDKGWEELIRRMESRVKALED